MSREEFIAWAVPEVELFLKKNPGERPVLHRMWHCGQWSDYELGKIEFLTKSDHAKIHLCYWAWNILFNND